MLALTFAVLSSPARGQAGVQPELRAAGFNLGSRGHTDCVNQNSGASSGKVAPKPTNPAPAAKAAAPELTASLRTLEVLSASLRRLLDLNRFQRYMVKS